LGDAGNDLECFSPSIIHHKNSGSGDRSIADTPGII